MKFKDKIEEDELRHTEEVKKLNNEIKNITNEMNQAIGKMKEEYRVKVDELYSVILDRDEIIADLESNIEDYKATLKDVSDNKADANNYPLITINNALRSNLKRSEKEINDLKKQKEDMKKIVDLVAFDKKHNEFGKELVKQFLDTDYNFKKSDIYKSNLSKNVTKIIKLMKIAGVTLGDLTRVSEVEVKAYV